MKILALKIGTLQMGPEKGSNSFDSISVIYVGHLSK
jgi:hypothetical protein